MWITPPDFIAYLEASKELIPGGWALLGVPLDMTTSFHQGTDHGPRELRVASDNLEDYCPICDASLQDRPFADLGDLEFTQDMDLSQRLMRVGEATATVLDHGARPLLLGGEHSLSAPAVVAVLERHPDLCVIQFDCHADLRESYGGTPHSHASVMRRIVETVPVERVFQLGIRSGTREEWSFMREHATVYPATMEAATRVASAVGHRPVYLTIDLDVLDSSVLPGTGTPEPGGIDYKTLESILIALSSLNIVAADAVELSPPMDPSGVSNVVAAKVVRTMLLSL